MTLKNILQLYALVICVFTVIILFVISGLSLNSVTNLMMPEYKNYSSLGRYESNETYLNFREESYNPEARQEVNALKQLSPQELAEKRLKARKEFLEDNRRSNIEKLITYVEWALVAFIFFSIHWRIYKKAKEKS